MADLKIGTTIGGTPIWGKVNLPLTPSGDTLMYKTFKLYSEYDKPTPAEINALSKVGDVGNGTYTFISNDAPLIMQAKTADAANYLLSKDSSGNNNWFFGKAGAGNNLTMKSYALNTEMQFRADDVLFNKQITTTSGIRSTYSIATFNTSTNLGLVLSTNGSGYSELVRIGNDQVYEWGYGLRAYGNDDWRIGVARLYHQGFKPTAADVNAWSKTESDARFVQMTGTNKAQGSILSRSYNYFDEGGTISDFDYSGFFRTNGKDGTPALMINCAHSGARAHGRGVGFDYGSSAGDQAFSMYSYAFDAEGNYLGHARVYTTKYKPTAADVGLPNVPNTVHSANADANTVAVRDGAADLHCRLVRATYGNETRIEGAIAFRVNNSTDNYMRFCSDPAAIRKWLGGGSQPSTWATLIGTVPVIGGNGAMEVGKYIDFHDANSTNDYDVRLNADASLNIQTVYGNVMIGARNTSFCHIYTDRPSFVFDKGIYLNPTNSTSWLDMRTSNQCYSTLGAVSTGSASAIVRQEHVDRHFILGGLGNSQFGIYMINKSRTTNGTDASAYLQSDGTWVCNGNGNFNDVYIRSDKRLKSNIKLTTNHLDKIMQLNPVVYDKKATLDAETTDREIGLIAQDVEEIIPLAVDTGTDEHKLKALKPYALIATLIGAVKELTKRVEELENGRS